MVQLKFNSDDREARRATIDIIDCDQSLVNSLRRVILAEVPYVALVHEPYATDGSQFAFKANTTVLHDHILAHRMSMVPIHLSKLESQAYIPGSIRVRLSGENKGQKAMDLTTENIEVFLHDQPHPDSKRLYPADQMTKDWPLMNVLKPGEKMDIEATAISGIASKNAAFAVVSLCTFAPILDEAMVKKGYKVAEESADPVRALNRFEHIDRKRCWVPGEDGQPTSFTFKIDSECGMSARDILEIAVDVLEKKIAASKCSVSAFDVGLNAYTLEVKGEDHTFGNIIQSMAIDYLVTHDGPLKYVGYYCTHPLERIVLIKIVTRDDKITAQEAFDIMKSTVLERIREFKKALLGKAYVEPSKPIKTFEKEAVDPADEEAVKPEAVEKDENMKILQKDVEEVYVPSADIPDEDIASEKESDSDSDSDSDSEGYESDKTDADSEENV